LGGLEFNSQYWEEKRRDEREKDSDRDRNCYQKAKISLKSWMRSGDH
jgi:hypothetical protein